MASPPLIPGNVTEPRETISGQATPGQYLGSRSGLNNIISDSIPFGHSFGSSDRHDLNPSVETPRGPGRPRVELAPRNEQAINGLYLSTSVTLQNLVKGIQKAKGPGRQFVRRHLAKRFWGSEEAGADLDNARLKGPRLRKQRDQRQRRAHKAWGRQQMTDAQTAYQHQDHDSGRPRKVAKTNAAQMSNESSVNGNPSHHGPTNILDFGARSLSHGEPTNRFSATNSVESSDIINAHYQPASASRRFSASTSPVPSQETIRAPDEAHTRKPSSYKGAFDLGTLANELDDGKTNGFYAFCLRCLSFSRSTIASRLSTLASYPCTRTRKSDFYIYYYAKAVQVPDAMLSRPDSTSADNLDILDEPATVAVNILMQAWLNGENDEAVSNLLQEACPERKEEQAHFVNVSDHRGVSPLHLATAYGFIKACCFLIGRNADHKARTANKESVYTFARPAKRLAGNNMPLSNRITVCREHASLGIEPPELSPQEESRTSPDRRCRKDQKKSRRKVQDRSGSGPQDSLAESKDFQETTMDTSSLNQSVDSIDTTRPHFSEEWFTSPANTIHNLLPSSYAKHNTHRETGHETNVGWDSMEWDIPRGTEGIHQPVTTYGPTSYLTNPSVADESVGSFSAQATYQPTASLPRNRRNPRRRRVLYKPLAERHLISQEVARSNLRDFSASRGTQKSSFQSQFGPSPVLQDTGFADEQKLSHMSGSDLSSSDQVTFSAFSFDDATDAFDFASLNYDPTYQYPEHTQPPSFLENHIGTLPGARHVPLGAREYFGQDYVPPVQQSRTLTRPPQQHIGQVQQQPMQSHMQYSNAGLQASQTRLGQQDQFLDRITRSEGGCPYESFPCGGYSFAPGWANETRLTCHTDRLCDRCSINIQQLLPLGTMSQQ